MGDHQARPRRRWLIVAVIVLQAPVMLFLYLPAGLLVPGGAWVLLNVCGVAFAAAGVVGARRGRRAALAIPALSVVWWFAYLTVGEKLFGWTA